MLFKFIISALLPTGLFLSPAISLADPILTVKDWSFSERPLNNTNGSVCVASTQYSASAGTFTLEVTKAKNAANQPVEIFIRVEKNKYAVNGFQALFNQSTHQIGFSELENLNGLQTFWGTPKNLSALLDQMQAGKEKVSIQGRGGKKDVDFEFKVKGFKDILAELEKQCNSSISVVNNPFESEFLGQTPEVIDTTQINSAATLKLRNIYFEAYDLVLQRGANQKALEQILAKYQPLIDQLNLAKAEQTQIKNSQLPQGRQQLAEAKDLQISASQEIKRLTALIPQQQNQLAISQKSYNQAQLQLDPLVPEYNRLNQRVASAQSNVNRFQNDLNNIDYRLNNLANEISRLQSEADTLNRNLPNKENRRNEALRRQRDAEREKNSFNVSYEQQKALQNNSEYNSKKRESQSLDIQINRVTAQVEQSRQIRDQKLQALNQCKSVAGQDCSALESEYNQAATQTAELTRQQRSLINDKSAIDNRVREIEQQVSRDVQNRYNDLVRREQEARSEVNRWDDEIRNDQNRISSIYNSELPRRQNEQNQLRNDRNQTAYNLQNSQIELQNSQRDLNQFKLSNDWDRKAALVESTRNQMLRDQSALNQTQREKSYQESVLQKAQADEIAISNNIQNLENRLKVLDANILDLEGKIQPLAAERAPYDQKISWLESELQKRKSEFNSRF